MLNWQQSKEEIFLASWVSEVTLVFSHWCSKTSDDFKSLGSCISLFSFFNLHYSFCNITDSYNYLKIFCSAVRIQKLCGKKRRSKQTKICEENNDWPLSMAWHRRFMDMSHACRMPSCSAESEWKDRLQGPMHSARIIWPLVDLDAVITDGFTGSMPRFGHFVVVVL